MSQYPSPYPGPPNYHQPGMYAAPYADPRGPAKRASLLMWILGMLTVCCAAGVSLVGSMPVDKLPPEQAQLFRQMESELHVPLRTVFIMAAVIMGTPGLLMIGLAFFVRRGGIVAIILAMILDVLLLLFLGFQLLGVAIRIAQFADPSAVPMACFPAIAISMLILLMVWLIQAAKNSSMRRAMQDPNVMQYWAYQQQQQMYRPQNYGQQQPPQYPPQS